MLIGQALDLVSRYDSLRNPLTSLGDYLDPELISRCLAESGTVTLRKRRLPLEMMVWCIVGMALERKEPLHQIVNRLDIMLPGMDGFSLCETIRHGDPYIGIIMASAKGQESDKIRGLSIGADDYITKPFSVSELMARVEALARRVRRSATADDEQAGSEPDQLVSGPFVLDEKSRVLYKSGKPIDLTQVEFQIMELFFRNPGTALVREKILEGVWGKGYFGDVKIVDVNIRRLRMKVEDEPSSPQHILTVWGYGYRWNA